MPVPILPKTDPDVEGQQDLFSSLTPTIGSSMGLFKESLKDTPGLGSMLRLKEFLNADKGDREYIDPAQLNERYGIEGHLDFSKTGRRTEAQAKLMYNHKLAEIERKDARERATGWGTAAALAQDFSAGMLDPLGLAVGLAVAPSKYLPGLANLRPLATTAPTVTGRAGAAFVTTTVDSAAGNAILEPGNIMAHQLYQADYGMADSLGSIAVGGVAGGALHAGGIGLHGLYSKLANKGLHNVAGKTPDFLAGTKQPTNETALSTAINQIMNGEQVSVEPILRTDTHALVRDEASAAREADLSDKSLQADEIDWAAELQALADEVELDEFGNKLYGGTVKQNFSERVQSIKHSFDERVSRVLDNVRDKVEFLGQHLGLGGKRVKYDLEGVSLNGVPFRHLDNISVLSMDLTHVISKNSNPFDNFSMATTSTRADGTVVPVAYGAVVMEPDGRVWLTKPKDAFGGYQHSIPKGRPNDGEDAYKTAIREVFEETGLLVHGNAYLGKFERSTTDTHYLRAERKDGSPQSAGPETDGMVLMPLDDAIKMLKEEGNENDWNVLMAMKALKTHEDKKASEANPLLKGAKFLTKVSTDLWRKFLADPDLKTYDPATDFKVRGIQVGELTDLGSGQLGSNKGGLYELGDGTKLYVKFPENQDHARSELAAHLLYRLTNSESYYSRIPAVYPVYEGKNLVGIGSEWIDDLTPVSPTELAAKLNDPRTSANEVANIVDLHSTWIFDAWIGNYDVYGTGPTWNIQTDGSGNYYKIDFGGSLLYRAQGSKKTDFGHHITPQLESFPKHAGAPLHQHFDLADGAEGARLVLAITPAEIKGVLKAAGYEGKELADLRNLLVARQEDLAARVEFADVTEAVTLYKQNAYKHVTVESALDHLKNLAAKVKSKLTPQQIKSIHRYQNGSSELNLLLFKDKQLGEDWSQWVKDLDEAMQPLPEAHVVSRWESGSYAGFTPDDYANMQHGGSVYLFKGFQSTSLAKHADAPSKSHGSVNWVVTYEKGVPFIPTAVTMNEMSGHINYAEETEVIFGRNQLLLVKGAVQKQHKDGGNYWEIHATVLAPDRYKVSAPEAFEMAKKASLEEAAIKAGQKPEGYIDPKVQHEISTLVDSIYTATPKKPEIPVLTDVVDTRTELMKQLDAEIKELEASIKNGLSEDEVKDLNNLEALKTVNDGVKKSDQYSEAIYQAWTCYKTF